MFLWGADKSTLGTGVGHNASPSPSPIKEQFCPSHVAQILFFVFISRFEKAHYEYIASLSGDLEDWECEGRYFKEHCERKAHFELSVKQWIENTRQRSETRDGQEIRPEDSVSSASSHRSRTSSSVSFKQLKAKESLARLKMEQLKEKQELLRKEEEMNLERQILEAKYELEQASLQVKIIEGDNSVIGDALPQMSKQPGPSIGELNSKHVIEPKVRDFKVLTGTKLNEDNDDVICRSLLNPCAKEFSYPAVKADSELSCSNTVNSDVAIVEDVLDKLGSTIRQGFALPKPDLSTFNGNPMEYWSFIRSFENTIERNA